MGELAKMLSEIEIEDKMYEAVGDQLKKLQGVLSYLTARKEAAIKFFRSGNPMVKYQCAQYVEFCNEEIKKILGV